MVTEFPLATLGSHATPPQLHTGSQLSTFLQGPHPMSPRDLDTAAQLVMPALNPSSSARSVQQGGLGRAVGRSIQG